MEKWEEGPEKPEESRIPQEHDPQNLLTRVRMGSETEATIMEPVTV